MTASVTHGNVTASKDADGYRLTATDTTGEVSTTFKREMDFHIACAALVQRLSGDAEINSAIAFGKLVLGGK